MPNLKSRNNRFPQLDRIGTDYLPFTRLFSTVAGFARIQNSLNSATKLRRLKSTYYRDAHASGIQRKTTSLRVVLGTFLPAARLKEYLLTIRLLLARVRLLSIWNLTPETYS